jgi:hypothetical protein
MKISLKTLIPVALLAAGFSSTTVLADNPNWSPEKAAQVAVNRCANAGKGNGKERIYADGSCGTNLLAGGRDNPEVSDGSDGQKYPDIDPGKSGKNANNRN